MPGQSEQKNLLEVIACSVSDAIAAEQGGADRLELISHFEVGGLTPPIDLVREVVKTVNLPIRVMVRETESFFIKDEKKIERLCEVARSLAELRIEGLVLGFLKEDRGGVEIDHELLARVLACAPKLKATFHRAFELLPDPVLALTELKRHAQIDRVLTGGGEGRWLDKVERFVDWTMTAHPEIDIIVGNNVDRDAIELLRGDTPLREFHIGRAARKGGQIDGAVTAARVRELANLIK